MAWLAKRYPLIAKRMNWASFPKFHCFFVDFNCIIHEGMRLTKSVDSDPDQTELVNEIFRYLDVLVRVIKPQNLLFISVDGPAPLAKCIEQRKRRFQRARTDKPGKFDANLISVGTDFMESLNKRLHAFIEDRMKQDPVWRKPQIVYSTHRSPGEGEHKFFDFIRAQKKAGVWKEDATCCVYSPDADLVFICLQSQVQHFCILRESDKIFPEIPMKGESNDTGIRMGHGDFVLVYIDLIKEYLMFDFQVEKEKAHRLFDDFAAITYLIGNDFITKLPGMCADSGDLTTIMDVYFKEFAKKECFLVDGDKFVPEMLKRFLQLTEASVRGVKGQVPDMEAVGQERLRKLYPVEYQKNSPELERNLCHAVIDSFYWVLKYYKYGCPSWTWYFPYEHAPTAWTVAKYTDYVPEFEEGVPADPLVHLMAILPPQNSHFLPESLREYMSAPEMELATVVNVDFTRAKVREHASEFTPEETERNTIIPPFLLKFVDGNIDCQPTDYASIDLGEITPCFIPTLFGPQHVIGTERPQRGKQETFILRQSLRVNEREAKRLIGKTVLVGWPHFLPALVVGVSNDKGGRAIADSYRRVYGLDISGTNVILDARPLMYQDINECAIVWATHSISFPLQLTVPLWGTSVIRNFAPRAIEDVSPGALAYDIKTRSLIKVTRVDETNVFGVKMRIPDMSRYTSAFNNDKHNWITMKEMAEGYGLSESALTSVLTSLDSTKYHIDIAFKCIRQKKGVVGFFRQNRTTMMVVHDLRVWLDRYFEYTGNFLSILQAKDGASIMNKVDAYIDEVGEERAKEIRTWVKSNSPTIENPMGKMYMFTVSAKTLSQYEQHLRLSPVSMVEERQELRYPKAGLVWRGCYRPLLQEVKFGERIVVVNQSGLVPFGTPGVVIMKSFAGRVVHVVADVEFEFGYRLFGRLQTKRGFIVPVTDVALVGK